MGFMASRVDVQAHGISEDRLISEEWKFLDKLHDQGLNVRDLPKVCIQVGDTVTTKRRFGSHDFIVTMPPSGVNKSRFRTEVFKAHARVAFEAMRRQQPDRFVNLTLRFDKAFRDSQRLLCDFYRHTDNKDHRFKAIALMWWGRVDALKKPTADDPEKVGLVDYSKRKTWQDEAASIYASIRKKGWQRFSEDHATHLRKAQAALNRAQDKVASIPWYHWEKRAKARTKMKAAEAKFLNLELTGKKAKMIRDLLC
jgi:hypothetical protein